MKKQIVTLLGLVVMSATVAFGQERAAAPAGTQRPAAEKPAPATPRVEVLVLGVYHMANPGRDIFNTRADDVLAPKRQAEIAELVEVLKKFRPTKIAIESDANGPRPGQYAEYLAGRYTLTQNEIDQLGFRLAKELGHKTVYPVDADGDFPYQRLVNYAKGSGRTAELDALNAEVGATVKAQNEYLASHTVLETLLYMNAGDKVSRDNEFYYRIARIGEPGDWAGSDLLSEWFRRNMRIYGNVVRIADAPNDRVLMIFGAGHLAWLRHDFASDPNFVVRDLAEFAR